MHAITQVIASGRCVLAHVYLSKRTFCPGSGADCRVFSVLPCGMPVVDDGGETGWFVGKTHDRVAMVIDLPRVLLLAVWT